MKLIIHRYEGILVGSLLLLSGAVIPSSWEPTRRSLPKPVVIEPVVKAVTGKRPRIALTFDDGPHPIMTERLLQVLRREHVPATFFIVGKMGDRYPQLIREMAEDGDEVANHTYSHPRLPSLSNRDILTELDETRSVIQRLTGKDSVIYRPPGGDYSKRMVRATARAGYHMILWSILTKDVQGASEHAIYHRIVDGAQDGGVILMHSGVPNTVAVLAQAIQNLRQKGYAFVTVSQLLDRPVPSPREASSENLAQAQDAPSAPAARAVSDRPHLE